MNSVLLIDDETNFHDFFVRAFDSAKESEYEFILTSSGLQGLRQTRSMIDKKRAEKIILVIDMKLPDFSGENLIQILEREDFHENEVKAVLISAHRTLYQLRQLKRKYDWIYDCLLKPIDTTYLKNVVDRLCGKSLKIVDAQQSKEKTSFDYQQLDGQTADFILQKTQEIKLWMKQTTLGAIESGEKIIQIKQLLDHGQFQDWVKLELGCTHSTALSLMRAARVFGSEKERIASSGIGLSVLYLLSQRNTPEELREQVLEVSESSESPVSFTEAKKLKARHLDQPKNRQSATPTNADRATKNPEATKTVSSPIPPQTKKQEPKQKNHRHHPAKNHPKTSPTI